MRVLLPLLVSWLTTVSSHPSARRRELIPATLKKKLCEKDYLLFVCRPAEPLKATDVDDNYSKWSICDYHPELLLCRWHNKPIPPVDEGVAQSSSEDFDENPFAVEPDLTAFDMNKATIPVFPSAKSMKPSKDKEDQNMLQATKRYLHQSVSAPVTVPRQPQPPRYDGKLVSERETAVSYATKRKEASDEDKFDENIIMVASEDVFG